MRDAEETCGHTVVDADGIEEPCGLPVALGGWRYYEGHEHEDTLRRVCADHEQWALSNGIRARDAEVRAATLAGFDVSEEWRVVGMDGPHSRMSGTYPEREFVDRIREKRGGVVQRRKVAATEWEPEP